MLFDQFNRPIQRGVLTKEIAGPTTMGVRSPISGHPAQGLTPQRLAGLLLEAEQGDHRAYAELAEEMEEKDLHYRSVLATRKTAVSQLEITVEPASDNKEDVANAELVETFLERDEIEDELFDMLDAVGKGFSLTEIIWDQSEKQWMPRQLLWRRPEWFEFDRIDLTTPLLKGVDGPIPLPPFKFIPHVHKSKSGIPVRGGLARPVAWMYLFKNYGIKDWVAFAEIFGQPLRLGKFHPGATADEQRELLRAVAAIGSDAAAIIPSNMLMEFVEAKVQGSTDLYERMAVYIDKQVSKCVLGQTMTTDEGSSLSQSQTHEGIREDIERSDAKQLKCSLKCHLVIPLVDLNRGPQQAYPTIQIGRPEDDDPNEVAERLAKMVPLGLKVGQEEARRKLRLREPEKDEELLPGRLAGAQPPDGESEGAAPPPEETADETAEAAARAAQAPDAFDVLIDGLAAEGTLGNDMEPILAPIRRAFAKARSYEELRDGLTGLLPQMDSARLGEALAQAMFQGAIAGRAGAEVDDQLAQFDRAHPES